MIEVENLSMTQGAFSLAGVSFRVPRGRYGVLMGKTGSGKTSVLEAISGLKSIRGGRISLLGRDVTGMKPGERGLGYVPQDRALFGTMTVREHLAFALVLRKWDRAAIERRVGELAELLGVAHLLSRWPQGLSGGEAQRVALGRALAPQPDVLLFDEPLSALDEETARDMIGLLHSVRERAQVTVLHVTHNLSEALALADVLLRLEAGVVREAVLPDQPGRAAAGDAGRPFPLSSR